MKLKQQSRGWAVRGTPWWCSPVGLTLGLLLPMFALVAFAVDMNLPGLTARGALFLELPYLLLGAGLIGVLALGGALGQQIVSPHRHPPLSADVDRAAAVVGSFALMAYLIWFREYLVNPSLLWSILSGHSRPGRADELVAGITSLANGAPAFFSIYAWRRVFRSHDRLPRWMHLLAGTLGVLTAFRVYAWSERLALIEAALPVVLMAAASAAQSDRSSVRWMVRLGPVLALPMLTLYFGLAESVRSWTSDTYNGKIGFWDFAVGRMVTYYFTALNNGAGYLATQDWPTFRFEYSLSMLHTAPFGVGPVFSNLVGSSGQTFDVFLARYADVEFNNPSGLYTVVYDMGLTGAVVYFALVGIGAGILFRRYGAGSLTGALFYPLLFVAFLEIFRYPYLGSGRAFAWALCGLLVLALVYPGRFRQGGRARVPTDLRASPQT